MVSFYAALIAAPPKGGSTQLPDLFKQTSGRDTKHLVRYVRGKRCRVGVQGNTATGFAVAFIAGSSLASSLHISRRYKPNANIVKTPIKGRGIG